MNTHRLKIVADKNIPFIRDAFDKIGALQLLESEHLTEEAVKHCDILIVRYVTRIDENFLRKSPVKFVGTVSAGTDHVDTEYLRARNIAFAAAPGSNAGSVAEYIIAALLTLHKHSKINIGKTTLGIIGAGNVGAKVAKKAGGLGVKILLNDPPKRRLTNNQIFRTLDELMKCDILTIHVPLILSGIDKTYHLFDTDRLSRLKRGAIIINSARGEVVDEAAIEKALNTGHIAGAVIDVWANEPFINRRLLGMTDIGTPHLAGLSQEGRTAATVMMHQSVCAHFKLSDSWIPLAKPLGPIFFTPAPVEDVYLTLNDIVRRIYDIDKDNADFKKDFIKKLNNAGACFTDFRKKYLNRREFSSRRLELSASNSVLKNILKTLGFDVH